jgi:hypothetical protein
LQCVHACPDKGLDPEVLFDFYIYQNNRLFLNLYPTRTKRVFVGKDEDGDFYFFRFGRKEVSVFKRKYEL